MTIANQDGSVHEPLSYLGWRDAEWARKIEENKATLCTCGATRFQHENTWHFRLRHLREHEFQLDPVGSERWRRRVIFEKIQLLQLVLLQIEHYAQQQREREAFERLRHLPI